MVRGCKGVDFDGISQAAFQADIEACAAKDAEIADLKAELNMKIDERDDSYVALNDKRSKVGQGVAGSGPSGTDVHPVARPDRLRGHSGRPARGHQPAPAGRPVRRRQPVLGAAP